MLFFNGFTDNNIFIGIHLRKYTGCFKRSKWNIQQFNRKLVNQQFARFETSVLFKRRAKMGDRRITQQHRYFGYA